jgi:hypothetical protein
MAFNPLGIFAGPSPLPPQTSTVTGTYAPTLFNQGGAAFAGGQSLAAGGESALAMAQAGQLTAPQQAQLGIYQRDLENQALTTYRGMGIEPTKSTSFLSTQQDIDQHVLAMSQQFIQSTIALGGAELSAGASFMGLGAQFEDAASKDLLATAQMQIQQDTAYSNLIGSTFASIAKMAGAAFGGPGRLFGGSSDGGTYEGNINTSANPSFS